MNGLKKRRNEDITRLTIDMYIGICEGQMVEMRRFIFLFMKI